MLDNDQRHIKLDDVNFDIAQIKRFNFFNFEEILKALTVYPVV